MTVPGVRSWLAGYCGAAILLGIYWLLAVTATRDKSTTFDEIIHLTAGYSYWLKDDYRLQPENGNLPQRFGALPLLVSRPAFQDTQCLNNDPDLQCLQWWHSDSWSVGSRFFYDLHNDPYWLLLQGRAVMALWGVAVGLLVYAWSRALFGLGGGILSLLLCLFCPTMLAHGPLITSDMTVAFFFLAAVGAWWRLLHQISPLHFAACFLALAGLFLAKFSAVLFVPMGLCLLALRLWAGQPLPWQCGRMGTVTGRWPQFWVFLVLTVGLVVLVGLALWAAYGFRYAAFADSKEGRDVLAPNGWEEVLRGSGALGEVVEAARACRLLPEAYLYGFAYTVKSAQARWTFFQGEVGTTGWFWFFPFAFLVKTPLPLLVVLVGALAATCRRWWTNPRGIAWEKVGRCFWATAPLWSLLVVYSLFALTSNLNIGHRHILPIYPVLYILAGAACAWLEFLPPTSQEITPAAAPAPARSWHGPRPRSPVPFAIVALAVILQVVEALVTYPHYLAYFNPLVGGSRQGYRYLVDSSLDWGQDLPGLGRWLETNVDRDQPVYLSYFGTGSPEHYHVKAQLLPGFFDRRRDPMDMVPLRPGIYCISATMLQGVYNPVRHRYTARQREELYQALRQKVAEFQATADNPRAREDILQKAPLQVWRRVFLEYDQLRLERLCRSLRRRPPDDHIGYSILIYRVTEHDLRAALK